MLEARVEGSEKEGGGVRVADDSARYLIGPEAVYVRRDEFAEIVCRYAHPWRDQRLIQDEVATWDELGPEQRDRIREWEEKPKYGEGRRYIPAKVRRAVVERDQGACQVCGSDSEPTLDHIVPYSRGGLHTTRNLRVLCRTCNSRKSARTPREWGER